MRQSQTGTISLPRKKAISRVHALTGKRSAPDQFDNQSMIMLTLSCGVFLIGLVIGLLIRRRISGKRINEQGYVLRKTKSGQDQYEHRMLAEEILGRRLEVGEVVHHINGRPYDNRIKNLCVMEGRDHDRYHEWYNMIRRVYGKYPRRETQLRKLREYFGGELLIDVVNRRNRSA